MKREKELKAKKEEVIEKLIQCVLYVGIVVLVAILMVSAGYSYLCEDDYSFAGGAADGLALYGNSFISSLHLAWRYYKTNQGTFLFNFLIHFINPYERWGLPGFHAYMICILLLFVYSVFYLVKSIIDDRTTQLVYVFGSLLVVFCSCFSEGVRELFLWYTGTLNFTLELSLSFITVGLMINWYKERVGLAHVVLASFLGFLASGGALIVTAAHCSWYLILLIMIFKKLSEKRLMVVPFITSLVGAFINALAPGNFARANAWVSEEHAGVKDALVDTFLCLKSENGALFTSKLFIMVILIIFVIACVYKKLIVGAEVSIKWMVLSWLSLLVVQYVSLFPIILGNHESILSAMRTREAFYVISIVMYMFCATMTGICLNGRSKKIVYSVIAVIAVLSLCLMIISGKNYSDTKNGFAFCVARDIKSGNLKNNYALRSYILNSIEMAEVDSDVILFLPYYECESTYGMGINEDPNNFVNNSIRNWKKIKSLTVYYWGYNWPPAEE